MAKKYAKAKKPVVKKPKKKKKYGMAKDVKGMMGYR